MKIGHLYWTQNGNWGDVVVGDITKKLFSYFIKDCIYSDINILLSDDNYRWDKYCEEINKNDVLLIGGGGILGWIGYFIKHTDFLNKIKIPIIIYAVGINSFRHADGTYDRIMFDSGWLELLKERCLFISVRNDGTKEEVLHHNGVDFIESPEPCLWTSQFYSSNRLIPTEYTVFCLANDMNNARLNNNKTSFDEISGKIYNVVNRLKKKGEKIQFVHHRINEEDYNLRFHNEIKWDIRKELLSKDVKKGLCLYQHAECVISMRGHGQIIPISYNIPVITIANQTKNSKFAEKMQIDDYLIDVAEKEMVDMVVWAIDDIKRNKLSIQNKILYNRANLWQRTVSDFDKIKAKLNVSI